MYTQWWWWLVVGVETNFSDQLRTKLINMMKDRASWTEIFYFLYFEVIFHRRSSSFEEFVNFGLLIFEI